MKSMKWTFKTEEGQVLATCKFMLACGHGDTVTGKGRSEKAARQDAAGKMRAWVGSHPWGCDN